MRRSLASALFIVLTAGLASQAAQATGNVLLPSAQPGGASGAPNLGLGASPSDQGSAPAVVPTQTQNAPAAAAPPAAAKQEPVLAPQAPQAPQPVPASVTTAPSGVMVVQQTDLSQATMAREKNLPYGLTIQMSGKSTFSAHDIDDITGKLGLTRDQIPSACFLTVTGVISSDKGASVITSGASPPPIQAHYDGTITMIYLTTEAMCRADINKLPAGGFGMLTRLNDRFDITLQSVSCDPPPKQATSLTITYDGSPKAQCVYQ